MDRQYEDGKSECVLDRETGRERKKDTMFKIELFCCRLVT